MKVLAWLVAGFLKIVQVKLKCLHYWSLHKGRGIQKFKRGKIWQRLTSLAYLYQWPWRKLMAWLPSATEGWAISVARIFGQLKDSLRKILSSPSHFRWNQVPDATFTPQCAMVFWSRSLLPKHFQASRFHHFVTVFCCHPCLSNRMPAPSDWTSNGGAHRLVLATSSAKASRRNSRHPRASQETAISFCELLQLLTCTVHRWINVTSGWQCVGFGLRKNVLFW